MSQSGRGSAASPVFPEEMLRKWQDVLDLLSTLVGVPAALIRRIEPPVVEVFLASRSEGNPYVPGERAPLNEGLYCDQVMAQRSPLRIPHALEDVDWKDSPDIERGMISYLGLPLMRPDGRLFGTLCVLDRKANPFSSTFEKLLQHFRDTLEVDLRSVAVEQEAEERSRAQLEATFQAMSDGVVVFDMAGNVVLINEAEARICGYPSAEDMRRDLAYFARIFELSHPDGSLLPVEEWPVSRVLRGETLSEWQLRGRRKDTGQEWFFAYSGAPVRDKAGRQVLALVITRDITEHKRAEQTLRASEQRFALLFQKAPFATALVKLPAGVLVDVNQAWVDLFEIPRDEALGKTSSELGLYQDPEDRKRLYEEFARKGMVRGIETRLSSRSGVVHQVLNNMDPIELEGEKYLLGSLEDVTERRRAEEQLRESERQFRTLADSIPQLAWIAEADGSIHWYNQRWYEYTGTTLEEMEDEEGWGWKKVHSPTELPRVVARFRAAVASGQPWEDVFPLRRKDGEFRLHLSRALPLRDGQGKVVRWFGTNTDVEEQRRAETALAKSEARLRAFFEANLIGIIFFDLEGGITEANDAFLQSVGYTREDLREGRIDWRQLTPPEWQALDAKLVEEMLQTGKHLPAEKEYFRKDGTRLPLIVASTFFPESRKEGAGFILDITERKAAEEQRRRVYEFQDRLIGIASHDIRSPTAAILTTSQMLLARQGLDAKLRRPVERIARSAARVERLIGALLDYTRARLGGGIPLTPQPMDLREVVAREGEEARAGHPARELILALDASVPGVWDAQRLAQVVSSLLENALKYGDPEKPIRVSLREKAGEAVLEVHNEGTAIPKALLPSLFEPFQRGEQRDETIKLSLGLGLYIVREVVRAHGGFVEVESDEVRGTTFRVHLPVERQDTKMTEDETSSRKAR